MSEGNDNIGALSAEEIKKLIDRLCPPLYYGTSDAVSRGKVLHFKGDDFTPEFLTLHPDDVDEVRAKLQGTRRLVHLSKRPPEDFLPTTTTTAPPASDSTENRSAPPVKLSAGRAGGGRGDEGGIS